MGEHTFAGGDQGKQSEMEAVAELMVESEGVRVARLEAIGALDASGSFAYDGYTSVSAFLIHRCGMGPGEAKRDVFLARSLRDLEYAVKATRAGHLSVNQLEVLAYARSRHPERFAADEPMLGHPHRQRPRRFV